MDHILPTLGTYKWSSEAENLFSRFFIARDDNFDLHYSPFYNWTPGAKSNAASGRK